MAAIVVACGGTDAVLTESATAAPVGFGDQLPRLVVETSEVSVTLAASDSRVEVVHIGRDGNGRFEWDFRPPADAPWLVVRRPLVAEEGDVDTLILAVNSADLYPGEYEASVTVFAVPVARDSPQTIRVSLEVTIRE